MALKLAAVFGGAPAGPLWGGWFGKDMTDGSPGLYARCGVKATGRVRLAARLAAWLRQEGCYCQPLRRRGTVVAPLIDLLADADGSDWLKCPTYAPLCIILTCGSSNLVYLIEYMYHHHCTEGAGELGHVVAQQVE